MSTLNFKASLKLGCRSQDLGPANQIHWASLLAQSVKNLPAMQESACNAGDQGSIPGSEISPGKEMSTHCSILAWKIPRTEERDGL